MELNELKSVLDRFGVGMAARDLSIEAGEVTIDVGTGTVITLEPESITLAGKHPMIPGATFSRKDWVRGLSDEQLEVSGTKRTWADLWTPALMAVWCLMEPAEIHQY